MTASDAAPVNMFCRLYALLSNALAGYHRRRQHEWNDRAVDFEFISGAQHTVVIDIYFAKNGSVPVHAVPRNCYLDSALAKVLSDMPGNCVPTPEGGAKLEVKSVSFGWKSLVVSAMAARTAGQVTKARDAIAAYPPMVSAWTAQNGTIIEYVDRESRRNSRWLAAMLTSIRTNRQWLDFGGTFGDTMKAIRARLLFVIDDYASEYNYHWRLKGTDCIDQATLSFLRPRLRLVRRDLHRQALKPRIPPHRTTPRAVRPQTDHQ